jgi:palmitoyl-protein thioesterase
MKFWSIISTIGLAITALATKPIVLMHGILSDTTKIAPVAEWLHINTNATPVYPIEIGNGKQASISSPLPDQLQIFCQKLSDLNQRLDGNLSSGINLIGISQGGLIARGYVQHCNDPPVDSLITWVTPHGGVYGFPIPDIYTPAKQAENSWSGYWRDPFQYRKYLANSVYLAKLNNEQPSAETEKNAARMAGLKQFVMIWSPLDDVLDPPESGKFSQYIPGILPLRIAPVEATSIWTDLSLDKLNSTNRLHIFQTDCDHADHVTPACLDAWGHYTLPFLT